MDGPDLVSLPTRSPAGAGAFARPAEIALEHAGAVERDVRLGREVRAGADLGARAPGEELQSLVVHAAGPGSSCVARHRRRAG